MKSIQGRLILAIALCSLLLSTATSALIYRSIRANLIQQFDRSLQVKASAISSFVQWHPDGKIDFEYSESAMPEYQRAEHAEFFVIRFSDGKIFARSQSLHHAVLPALPAGKMTEDVPLPNGRVGRAVSMNFVPQEDWDSAAQTPSTQLTRPAMSITVSKNRASLDASLNRLLRTFLIGTILLAITAASATILIVRRALRPLRMVADQTARIDSTRLDLRFPDAQLPTELTPISTRFNELLDRLEAAFKRERRFSSDVAHELRTPIAELRCVAEVALMHPADSDASAEALNATVEISKQMERLVNCLLALMRDTRQAVSLQPVELGKLLSRLIEGCQKSSAKIVNVNLPAEAIVMAEPALLSSALANILNNAFEYSTKDAPITCDARPVDGRWMLSVENATADLSEHDLPHLQEPFWRKDESRTDCGHPGLGLSLVASYCALMNVGLSVQMPQPTLFRISLTLCGSSGLAARAASATDSIVQPEGDALIAAR